MKKIMMFFLFTILSNITLADYPKAESEYVNDFAQVIDKRTHQTLKKMLYEIEYSSGVEIAVVTIDSFGTYKTSAKTWEGFSTGLFNNWGIGNLPENNGVLIMISKNDRKIRIELGAGYSVHYNDIMKTIIKNDITPWLKMGDYNLGIMMGAQSVIDAVTIPISFLEWHKYHILAGVLSLTSLLFALYAKKTGNKNTAIFFISLAGFLFLWLLTKLANGNASDGFGGGGSSGGGASGDF